MEYLWRTHIHLCYMHRDTVARSTRNWIELNWIQHEYAISIRLKACIYSAFKCTIFSLLLVLSFSVLLNANQLKSHAENDKNLCKSLYTVYTFIVSNSSIQVFFSLYFYLCFVSFLCPFIFFISDAICLQINHNCCSLYCYFKNIK